MNILLKNKKNLCEILIKKKCVRLFPTVPEGIILFVETGSELLEPTAMRRATKVVSTGFRALSNTGNDLPLFLYNYTDSSGEINNQGIIKFSPVTLERHLDYLIKKHEYLLSNYNVESKDHSLSQHELQLA